MAIKITDIEKDLPMLNKELAKFDSIQQELERVQNQSLKLNTNFAQLTNRRSVISTNNLVLTWSGTTLKLSWPAAYVRDLSQNYFPIPAGTSQPLLASTYYWVGWNPDQHTMSFQTLLDSLTNIPNILVLCQIFTGTAAQTGTAGGGGSVPSLDDLNGAKYKLF